jgi:hypothetical protein
MVTALTVQSGAVTLPWEIDENVMRAELSPTEMAAAPFEVMKIINLLGFYLVGFQYIGVYIRFFM